MPGVELVMGYQNMLGDLEEDVETYMIAGCVRTGRGIGGFSRS